MPQDQNVTPLKEELKFDGERFVPGAGVEITYHHWLRYFFARQLAADKRVLDVAFGEGYGAVYLSGVAGHVDAFDVSAEAVAHARAAYADNARINFMRADIEGFFRDAKDGAYDLVTAFEVIEHVDEPLQLTLLEGIRRVLAPGGVALISTPDKQLYSDARLTKNPFHVREMYRDEFAQLVGKVFPHARMFDQLAYTGSAVVEGGATKADLCEMGWTNLLRLKGKVEPSVRAGGEYLIALVSAEPLSATVENAVMLDRSRKLVGEEVYAKQAELDERKRRESEARAEVSHMRDVVADMERQIAEIKKVWVPPEEAIRKEAMANATIDRLLAIITRNLSDSQSGAGDLVGGARDVYWRSLYERERQAHQELRGMVSVRLIGKAKGVWDRVPFVKNAVKAVVKKVL